MSSCCDPVAAPVAQAPRLVLAERLTLLCFQYCFHSSRFFGPRGGCDFESANHFTEAPRVPIFDIREAFRELRIHIDHEGIQGVQDVNLGVAYFPGGALASGSAGVLPGNSHSRGFSSRQ